MNYKLLLVSTVFLTLTANAATMKITDDGSLKGNNIEFHWPNKADCSTIQAKILKVEGVSGTEVKGNVVFFRDTKGEIVFEVPDIKPDSKFCIVRYVGYSRKQTLALVDQGNGCSLKVNSGTLALNNEAGNCTQ